MHKFKEIKKLSYSVKELFDLVLDIEKYPDFLPWIDSVVIIEKNNVEIIADMTIKFKSIRQNYRSNIKFEHKDEKAKIEVNAYPGIFEYLYNIWNFARDEDHTIIEFDVNFKFKSKFLDVMATPLFTAVSKKMIIAFENRAKEKYGRN